eukprot:3515333-Rhodomonas_salina.1
MPVARAPLLRCRVAALPCPLPATCCWPLASSRQIIAVLLLALVVLVVLVLLVAVLLLPLVGPIIVIPV